MLRVGNDKLCKLISEWLSNILKSFKTVFFKLHPFEHINVFIGFLLDK